MIFSYLQEQMHIIFSMPPFLFLQNIYFLFDHQIEKNFNILREKGFRLIDILLFTLIAQVIAFIVLKLAFKCIKCLIFGIWFFRTNLIKFSINYIPAIIYKLNQKIKEALDDMQKKQDEFTFKKTTRIPDAGIKVERIYEKTKKLLEFDQKKGSTGKISGAKYYEQDNFNSSVVEFAKQFLYHNLLHFDLYVSVRQMEAELIAMTSTLFHGDPKNPYGVTTSGGSESICMAVLAARNYCERYKGITEPELVAACTVHTAFDKACSMLKIKFRKIDVDPKTFQIDLKKMKRAINKRTILIVGSCPNFPHGIVDPIEEMAAIAKRRNILFHVDGCLGSMCLPFANELGQPVPRFDLSLEGVTSLSIDHHKHGLAPKGVSVVIYKTAELRHSQYYASLEWPGGAYGTPSIGGSRPGAPIAGAWFAMMNLGKAGYKDLAQKIFNALNYVKQNINKIPEIELIGNPIVNTLAFRSTNEKNISSYSIKKALRLKGWDLTGTQKPPGIHISLTQSFAKLVVNFINDVKIAIQEVKNEPDKFATNAEATIYGSAEMMPVGDISQFRDFVIGLVDITLTV